MCFTPCIETLHDATALLYLRKRKYNIRCKYCSAFPFDYSTLYRFNDFSPLLLLWLSLGDVILLQLQSLSISPFLFISLLFYSTLLLYYRASTFVTRFPLIFLSLSFSLTRALTLAHTLVLTLSLFLSLFLPLSIYRSISTSNRLYSSVSVRDFVSRAIYSFCIYTRAAALSIFVLSPWSRMYP